MNVHDMEALDMDIENGAGKTSILQFPSNSGPVSVDPYEVVATWPIRDGCTAIALSGEKDARKQVLNVNVDVETVNESLEKYGDWRVVRVGFPKS